MKTDTLFYRLFQTDPSLALELAGLAVPSPGRYRFGSHEIKQTRFYQQAVSEGRQEGIEEGIEKGMEKGMEKGRVEGEATLLLRLLERRFGPLPAAIRQRIAAANAETLLAWGERVLDARSLDEVWGH